MIAICRKCGANVELGNALQERRQVACPSCGAIVARGIHGGGSDSESTAAPEQETVKYPDWALSPPDDVPEKKKLSVIRPPKSASKMQDQYGGLYDAEKRAKMYDQMKHRMWLRKYLKSAFEVAILLGTLFSMWFVYKAWDSHLEHKREMAAAERAAEAAREAERTRLRREEQDRERAIKEAERAAKRAEQEQDAQARRLAEQEKRETIEYYKLYIYALRENDFDMFGKSVTNCLSEVGGELCYLLPEKESENVLYWASCQTNGEIRVLRISEHGGREEVAACPFFERISKLDYLVAGGDKVYYHSHRKDPLWGRLSKTQQCDPAKVFFDGLYDKLESINPTYDEIRFDIVFIPKNSQKRIICEKLEFGCAYSLDNVREAVEQAFPPKVTVGGSFGSKNAKKFKRTVKIWNGSQIKEGLGGITYVPRTPPTYSHNSARHLPTPPSVTHGAYSPRIVYTRVAQKRDDTARWQALYNKALQEDKEEEEFYMRQKESVQRKRQKRSDDAERAYIDRIDNIINEGEIYYHARRWKSVERDSQ